MSTSQNPHTALVALAALTLVGCDGETLGDRRRQAAIELCVQQHVEHGATQCRLDYYSGSVWLTWPEAPTPTEPQP